MSFDTKDKKYIYGETNKMSVEIRKDFEHHTGVLVDEFRSQTKLIIELINTRPSREEMNSRFDVVENDIRLIKSDISMLELRVGALKK